MPQISKVERDHNIRQVSRLDDLRPATEKTIIKVVPIIDQKSGQTELTATMDAARRSGLSAIRQARALSGSSDKTEDQEAIDILEASARSTSEDTALAAKESLRRQIKKKRADIKTSDRSIQKADRIRKNVMETSEIARKNVIEAAKQSAIASQKVLSARKTEQVAKKSAEWVKRIVRGIIEGIKQLSSALGAAAVPLMLILVLAGLIGGIVASSFGIFFAGDQSGKKTKSLQEVVLSINSEYNNTIESIKKKVPHDELTTEGYQAPWPDVLSVYAVYVTTKTDGATDVVHLTDDHVKILKEIFWQMNTITYTTEVVKETIQVPDLDSDGNQKKDKDGNLLYKEETISKTVLHICINHLSASEEASNLSFNAEQMAQLNELLDVKYATLWSQILKGVGQGSSELVNLALSQLGNEGGEKFWRWAGLDERCAWCALFVSWCADQTGLMASGQIPYFSFVSDGVDWFKDKGRWIDGSAVNSSNYDKLIQPGMIIFFDWEPDGKPNHVGIVTKVSNGYIYTVEGNRGDAVAEGTYSADSIYLYGFGVIG